MIPRPDPPSEKSTGFVMTQKRGVLVLETESGGSAKACWVSEALVLLRRLMFSQKPSKGPAQQRKAKRLHPKVTTSFKTACSGLRDLTSQWRACLASSVALGSVLSPEGKKQTCSERKQNPSGLGWMSFYSLPVHCLEKPWVGKTDLLEYWAQGTRALLIVSWWVPLTLRACHQSPSVPCL